MLLSKEEQILLTFIRNYPPFVASKDAVPGLTPNRVTTLVTHLRRKSLLVYKSGFGFFISDDAFSDWKASGFLRRAVPQKIYEPECKIEWVESSAGNGVFEECKLNSKLYLFDAILKKIRTC